MRWFVIIKKPGNFIFFPKGVMLPILFLGSSAGDAVDSGDILHLHLKKIKPVLLILHQPVLF